MILSVQHKGLRRLHTGKGPRCLFEPWFRAKVARIFARLDIAREPDHMALPGWSLQPIRGPVEGLWAVWVTAEFWIIFRFQGEDKRDGSDRRQDNNVVDVDLIEFSPLRRKQWHGYEKPPAPRTIGAA